MEKSTISQVIYNYLIVENNLNAEEVAMLTPDINLIECGIIDSMSILQILMFIESEYSIDLENISVAAEDMKTIASIEKFINKYKE